MLKVPASMSVEELEGPPVAGRRRRRRALAITAAALALLAVLVGLIVLQASTGSITLAFVSGRVEAALRDRLPPDASVSVGSTAFSYRSGQGVLLRIRDLRITLPGTASIRAAELSTRSSAAAIFGGRIELQSVAIDGVDIGVSPLRRQEAGSGNPADRVRAVSLTAMDQVAKSDAIMRAAGLQDVTIRNAALHIDEADGTLGPALRIAESTWRPLGEGRSKAWVQVLQSSGHDWDLTMETRRAASGVSTLTAEFEDVPMSALAPGLTDDRGPYFRTTLTFQARIARAGDGSFVGLRGVLATTEGKLSLAGSEVVNLTSTALTFALDESGSRLAFPSGEVRTPTGFLRFEGMADLGEAGAMTLIARVRDGSLPTTIGDAVAVTGGGGVARVDFAEIGIDVQEFRLETPQGSASLVGQASAGGKAPGLTFALSLTEMPASVARAIWPPFVASKTRTWFDANVRSGRLGPATLQVALPPDHLGAQNRGKVLPDTALIGTVPFREGEFSPVRAFPVIHDAAGGITFGDATASIWAQSGAISVPGKGDVEAGGTTLIIPELGRLEPRGELHLELSGAVGALAALSNTPPLSVAEKNGIDADTLSGNATLSLDASIPIEESNFADVIPAFRLTLADFSSSRPIEKRSIADADLVLEGSPKSYTVKGEGTLDGLQASVDMIMGTAAPPSSAVIVSLDDAARERLGFGLGALLTGVVQASLTDATGPRQTVALDLKQARLSLPFLGWEKGPGVPATASFIMEKGPDGTAVSNFVLSGKGFEARGEMALSGAGRVTTLELEKLALRPGDNVAVSATARGDGYDVTVRGASLDARGLIQGVRAGASKGSADIFPIRLSLDLDVVRGNNDVALADVKGGATITKNGLDTVALKGNSGSNQPFEWTLGRENGNRVLRLFADGGGALVRFSGIYSRVAGGNLILDYSGPIGAPGTGVAVMRDFRLVNEEALRPALNTTPSQADMRMPADTGNDLTFTQLRVPFKQENWVIVIDDAALRGPVLGGTASGAINLPDSKVALSGTFIPAFGLNNIPSSIPILGAILGGGRDEGLFGITYKLFGPLDGPTLTMNPISAIAPGIFRKIFEYR